MKLGQIPKKKKHDPASEKREKEFCTCCLCGEKIHNDLMVLHTSKKTGKQYYRQCKSCTAKVHRKSKRRIELLNSQNQTQLFYKITKTSFTLFLETGPCESVPENFKPF